MMRRATVRLMLLITVLAGCISVDASAPDRTPLPGDLVAHSGAPVSDSEVTGLARAVFRPERSQIENGTEVYRFVCMACHGDQGQGLTTEWRQVFGVEDSNCWQSKCHAANHPAHGFQLPRTVPAILGAGTLLRIANGAELYDVIARTMPWWNPGSLSSEESWALTAYLLRGHSALPDRVTVDPGNAPIFRPGVAIVSGGDDRPIAIAIAGLLAIAAVALIIQNARRR